MAAVAAAWHSLAHLAQSCCSLGSGAAILTSTSLAGHSQAQTPALPSPAIPVCCWLCIWGLPCLHPSLDRGEGARAELSHATCPGQRPQQGEASPVLPSPKAIKNEAHSAAHLSSDQITVRETAASPSSAAGAGNATWTAQHPRSRLSPPKKLTGKLGSRKRLHPLPYLPEER